MQPTSTRCLRTGLAFGEHPFISEHHEAEMLQPEDSGGIQQLNSSSHAKQGFAILQLVDEVYHALLSSGASHDVYRLLEGISGNIVVQELDL